MKIVLDATVWIDLHTAGLDERVLSLGNRICSVDILVETKLLEPDGAKLKRLGLAVYEVDGEGVSKAIQWRADVPQLSEDDVLSLALAYRHGWMLGTGDGDLRNKAEKEGVQLCDTLDILALLAAAGNLDLEDLQRFKRELRKADRNYDRKKAKQLEKKLRKSLQQ